MWVQERQTPRIAGADHWTCRPARTADVPELERLIELAFRRTGANAYSGTQIEAALADGVIGCDARLIEDGTYFVAEAADGALVGCGGWSFRRQSFGGSGHGAPKVEIAAMGDPSEMAGSMDPGSEPAWIRAFFVHPDWGRRGIGRRLLELAEGAARAAGFRRAELLATETGAPLYLACGYRVIAPAEATLSDGSRMTGCRMAKDFA